MQKIVFGTDGWRGLLDTELNLENIRRVAQAFSVYIRRKAEKGKVALGFDGRRNSGLFALEFGRLLMANGIETFISQGVVPTPVLSFFTRENACTAGVMITASHNPPEYNGLKFKSANGAPFSTEETAIIESLIDKEPPAVTDQNPAQTDFLPSYIKHLEQTIDLKVIRNAGLSVLIDSMGGAGMNLMADICFWNQVYCDSIFSSPETDFAGRTPEPIEKNLAPLSEALKFGQYSIGFATDGDADRLGVMDEKGRWVNIQQVILYLAEFMVQKFGARGGVVKTSSVTDKILSLRSEGQAVKVHDAQVGFKYVSETMLENDAVFGAEESGGFGFFNHLPDRDGIFSAFMVLQMLAESGEKTLSAFLEKKRKGLGLIFYDRIDMHTNNTERHNVLPVLEKDPPQNLAGFPVRAVKSFKSSRGLINGLKFHLEGQPRWLLLRVSETEPMVRIYAEAESIDEVRQLLAEGKRLFE
jgi:phosphomannomutase